MDTQLQSQTKSPVPVLAEGFREQPRAGTLSVSASGSDREQDGNNDKSTKRRLFGLLKKKDDSKSKTKEAEDSSAPATKQSPPSPSKSNHPYQHHSPASPNRNIYSSSPHLASPAGSQIFERDVQESALNLSNSPAIPSHIQRENHIPPVLDASSEAITNKSLDPDTVEIVTHTSHQPASCPVNSAGIDEVTGGVWPDELIEHPHKDDAAQNYAMLDSTDVHRLSFISFADVVQSEHAEHGFGRDSLYMQNLASMSSPGSNRTQSPVLSPVSSQGLEVSPPTSGSPSVHGIELSPSRVGRPAVRPLSIHGLGGSGELCIETMSQAMSKTGSGDLSGSRSQPLSPVSPGGFSAKSMK